MASCIVGTAEYLHGEEVWVRGRVAAVKGGSERGGVKVVVTGAVGGGRERRAARGEAGSAPRGHGAAPIAAQPVDEVGAALKGGAEHRGARVQADAHVGDQPVDVEERHHVEAHVVRRAAQRARDVLDAVREVGVRERHDLRLLGRAARMQHQRQVARVRRRGGWRRHRLAVEAEEAGDLRVGQQRQDGHAVPLAARDDQLPSAHLRFPGRVHDDHRVRRQVVQLKLDLGHGERRVQGREDALRCEGQEAHGGLCAVGHRRAQRVRSADAVLPQVKRVNERLERRKGQRLLT
jgi:hypothetical protein